MKKVRISKEELMAVLNKHNFIFGNLPPFITVLAEEDCKNCMNLDEPIVNYLDYRKCAECGRQLVGFESTPSRRIEKLTNDGKPHVCGEIAVFRGNKDTDVTVCEKCNMPVDSTPQKPGEESLYEKLDNNVSKAITTYADEVDEIGTKPTPSRRIDPITRERWMSDEDYEYAMRNKINELCEVINHLYEKED